MAFINQGFTRVWDRSTGISGCVHTVGLGGQHNMTPTPTTVPHWLYRRDGPHVIGEDLGPQSGFRRVRGRTMRSLSYSSCSERSYVQILVASFHMCR